MIGAATGSRTLPDWACHLPLTITVSTHEGCRLELDDAKKTMMLTSLPVP